MQLIDDVPGMFLGQKTLTPLSNDALASAVGGAENKRKALFIAVTADGSSSSNGTSSP